MRGVADDGAQIKAILQQLQARGIGVDDGDVVGLGTQAFRHRCADLARAHWEDAKEVIASGEYQVVVLDEFTYPLHYGWIPVEEVIEVLKSRPEMQHVIITGRHAPEALVEFADLVTEMRVIKHPYHQGIKAQPGIEF